MLLDNVDDVDGGGGGPKVGLEGHQFKSPDRQNRSGCLVAADQTVVVLSGLQV